ncbi:unnamed protein product [Parajaminaea phylloscopi]
MAIPEERHPGQSTASSRFLSIGSSIASSSSGSSSSSNVTLRPVSPSRSAMDGAEWRDHAQRSFLTLDEPPTPTLHSGDHITGKEHDGSRWGTEGYPATDYYRSRPQWPPSSPSGNESESGYAAHGTAAFARQGRQGSDSHWTSIPSSSSPPPPLMSSSTQFAQGISPPHKNTRGSRLGQQMGMAGQRSALDGNGMAGFRQEDGVAGRRLEAVLNGVDQASRQNPSSLAGSNTALTGQHSESRQLGAAFGMEHSTTQGLPAAAPAAKQQWRLSRLQYKAPDYSGRGSDADRAQRLAQSSISSLNAAFRRGTPTSAGEMDSPYSDMRQRRAREVRTPSASGWRSEDFHDELTGDEGDSSFISGTPSRPQSALDGSDASGQRELILPAIAGGGSASRPHSPAAAVHNSEGLERTVKGMTSVQRLRTGRDHFQGDPSGSGPSTSRHESRSNAAIPRTTHSTAGQDGLYRRDEAESSSGTPARSARGQHQNEVSNAGRSPKTPGTGRNGLDALSDADIAALGAITGQDPQSLLPANGGPLSSKNVLTIALAKAQSAVQYDSSNSVPEAIESYSQAVRLLQEVMNRIAPRPGSSKKTTREEERRRLKVIHDTYADRIKLLSMIYNGEDRDVDLSDGYVGDANTRPDGLGSTFQQQSQSQTARSAVTSHEYGDAVKAYPPQISISKQPATPRVEEVVSEEGDATPTNLSGHKELLRSSSDAARVRSDSEGSFRSAGSSALTGNSSMPLPEGSALPSHALKGQQLLRPKSNEPLTTTSPASTSLRLAPSDDLVPPATPYFDAEPTLGIWNHDRGAHGSLETSGPLAQATHRIARSPSLASRAVGSHEGARGLSSESRALSPTDRAAQSPEDVPAATHRRPRAVTLSSSQDVPTKQFAKDGGLGTIRTLVNASVHGGSIINRRKKETEAPTTALDSKALRGDLAESGTSSVDSSGSEQAARKRALSQPGGRRPNLSTTLHAPPLPALARKLSNPLLSNTKEKDAALPPHPTQDGLSPPSAAHGRSFRFPSPAPSASSGYHALLGGTPATASPGVTPTDFSWPVASANAAASISGQSDLTSDFGPTDLRDLFPSGLVSAQLLGTPSFATSEANTLKALKDVVGPMLLKETYTPPEAVPVEVTLRPFAHSRTMQVSLQRGGQLSSKLGVPPSMWVIPAGIKLSSVDTRVRLMELISNGIESVERTGKYLFSAAAPERAGLAAVQATSFAKSLEDLDLVMTDAQNTLSKKLSFIEASSSQLSTPAGSAFQTSGGVSQTSTLGAAKKSGAGVVGLSNFGSKITRSFDRMALSASSNKSQQESSGATYVEALSRCLGRAQVLEKHLLALSMAAQRRGNVKLTTYAGAPEVGEDCVEAHSSIPAEVRKVIEAKLKRASEFYASVILRCTLRDLSVLLDKSVKRGGAIIAD